MGEGFMKRIFFSQLGRDMGVISFVRLCFRGYLKSAVQAIQYSGTEAEYFGHLLLLLAWCL